MPGLSEGLHRAGSVGGAHRGFTQEFETFALTLMRGMPVKKAGEILGAEDHRLGRMLFAHVDAAWAALSWENVVWVGPTR